MITLIDSASMRRALSLRYRADLEPLLHAHLRHTLESGLAGMTHLLAAEAGDPESAIAQELGFSLLRNPLDGSAFPGPKFRPWFDDLRQDAGGWYVVTLCVANSGFAFIVLLEPRADELGLMCRRFVT